MLLILLILALLSGLVIITIYMLGVIFELLGYTIIVIGILLLLGLIIYIIKNKKKIYEKLKENEKLKKVFKMLFYGVVLVVIVLILILIKDTINNNIFKGSVIGTYCNDKYNKECIKLNKDNSCEYYVEEDNEKIIDFNCVSYKVDYKSKMVNVVYKQHSKENTLYCFSADIFNSFRCGTINYKKEK